MIAALDTPEDSSAANTKPSLPMGNSTPPVQTAQEDDTASDRLEIALLISAMYQEFKTSWRVFDEHKVPGFDSFGKFAIAFGLPHVYPGILAQKLNVRYNLSCVQLCDLPSTPKITGVALIQPTCTETCRHHTVCTKTSCNNCLSMPMNPLA